MKQIATLILGFISIVLWAQNPEDQNLAKAYFAKGEYENALKYAEDYGLSVFNKPIYEIRLNSYLELNKERKAEAFIKEYNSKWSARDKSAYVDLYSLYLRQLKKEKAQKLLDEIAQTVERNPSQSYSFGSVFQAKGYPKIALDIYLKAEESPAGIKFDYQKAMIYGELGQTENMYDSYIALLNQNAAYLANIKTWLVQAKMNVDHLPKSEYLEEGLLMEIQKGGPDQMTELLSFIYVLDNNYTMAFIQLKALEKRTKSNKARLFYLAKTAFNADEYKSSSKIFSYIIEEDRQDPFFEESIIFYLKSKRMELESSNSLIQSEEWAALNEDYEKFKNDLLTSPFQAELLIDQADILAFQLNRIQKAKELLQSSLSSSFIGAEDIAMMKIKLGDILLYSGSKWDAIVYYGQAEKAFEYSPIGQRAKFNKALAAYYSSEFEWALSTFDVLKQSTSKLIANDAMHYASLINNNLALDTSSAPLEYFAKADFLKYQSKGDSALYYLDLLDAIYPEHSLADESLFMRAEIFMDKNRTDDALSSFLLLIEKFPAGILADDALFESAKIYESLGQNEKAKKAYEQILLKHPDSFFTEPSRQRFRMLRGDNLNG